MLQVRRYFRRTTYDLIVTKGFSIKLYGSSDIYQEGQELEVDNLGQKKHISFNKILNSNNSLRCNTIDNIVQLTIYSNTNKRRTLKKIGTDNTGKPVLKFNDIWIRMSEKLFYKLKLNYLHSLNKEYKELININLDDYRIVIHSTRFGYPDITLYEEDKK